MKIAMISTILPTPCGIAYYSDQLIAAMAANDPAIEIIPIGISSQDSPLATSPAVPLVIHRDDSWTYRDAFEQIAHGGFSGILLQHEFGLFGGDAGSFILPDLALSAVPVVTAFHTILRVPIPIQRRIIRAAAAASQAIVSPTEFGAQLLRNSYGICREKINVIPHGVAKFNAINVRAAKRRLQVDGRIVVLTYGLLSEGKGIHYAIRSMADIVAHHPNVLYIVAGITHPRVRSTRGESYRLMLQNLVSTHGLQQNVLLLDRSFAQPELCELLGAADIFLCPYTSQEQIVSGTLSAMMAVGRPIVTTPFWHARELIEQSGAVGVGFNDAGAITHAILQLLEAPELGMTLSANARQLVRNATWDVVAEQYLSIFKNRLTATVKAGAASGTQPPAVKATIDIRHIQRLTTSVGMLQHCRWSIPLYSEGYCTDDNARALLLCCRRNEVHNADAEQLFSPLLDRYLAFLLYAYNDDHGRFRNFLSFGGTWLEEVGSEECHARALRALSYVMEASAGEVGEVIAEDLFVRAAPGIRNFASMRAIAIGVLAICNRSRQHRNDYHAIGAEVVERLKSGFARHADATWVWPEDHLTWFSAKIPHALIDFGATFADDGALAIGLDSLRWLTEIQKAPRGYFEPVGAHEPFCKGQAKPSYDQQPIEAWATIAACRAALEVTGNSIWLQEAETAFDWFLGGNSNRSVLVNSATGGCRDALTPSGVNRNEGAESLLAWQLSSLDICAARSVASGRRGKHAVDDGVRFDQCKE